MPIQGEFSQLRLFDLGGYLDMKKAQEELQGAFLVEKVSPVKGTPEYVSFGSILPLRLEQFENLRYQNGVDCQIQGKLFGVGVLSIRFHHRFEASSVRSIAEFWNEPIGFQNRMWTRIDLSREIFRQVRGKLALAITESYEIIVPAEIFTEFDLEISEDSIEKFVALRRRELAGLLMNEEAPERLAESEIEEILGTKYSYYSDEVSFLGWDSALVLTKNLEGEDEVLKVAELASLQLLELRTFDAYLDQVIGKSRDDLRAFFAPRGFIRGKARRMVAELSETRIELQRMIEGIQNSAKFFGDWYIARLYLGFHRRLHLDRWMRTVQEKLGTVESLYQVSANEAASRKFVLLEVMIVILFVLEILLIAYFEYAR